MYTSNVKYWVNFTDNLKERIYFDTLCFSAIIKPYSMYSPFDVKKLKSIVYKCVLPAAEEFILNKQIQDFYIDFLTKLSKKLKYSFQFRFLEDKNILFKIKLKNDLRNSPNKILLILTLHRYLQEFPEILIDFYKNKKNSLEENFIQFQESHNNTLEGKKYYDNRNGHSIVYGYKERHTTISLENFRFDIKKNSVQSYFIQD